MAGTEARLIVERSRIISDMNPEIALAQRLVQRRHLVPPIDIENLLREYALVEYVNFPVAIDGLCLDVKAIGKKPQVLVSQRAPLTRKRFTLAHELGHILIPWHLGSIIDEIDVSDGQDGSYFTLEGEANRFASELLLPRPWVIEQILRFTNPLEALFHIIGKAEVSWQAASIKFIDCAPPNQILAVSQDGHVMWSSRSTGTLAAIPTRGTVLKGPEHYPFPCEYWSKARLTMAFHCWRFEQIAALPSLDTTKTWRRILDDIVKNIIPDDADQRQFKASINGVTSNANGSIRIGRSTETIATAMLHRLHASAAGNLRFKALLEHPDFDAYCAARARAFTEK